LDLAIAQSEVWSRLNTQLIAESKRKNDFTFWLIFGLSPSFGLSETLSERPIQKVNDPLVDRPMSGIATADDHSLVWHLQEFLSSF